MLELKLRDLGATRAKIWIDRKRISDGDLFDGAIDDGLRKAELLLVVMSPNWMQRPYCRKELEAFADLRKKSGVANVAGAHDRRRQGPRRQAEAAVRTCRARRAFSFTRATN